MSRHQTTDQPVGEDSDGPQPGPVFVVGNSRSGTTLLARMLGRHPAIFTFRELHFFEELWDGCGAPAGLSADAAGQLAHRLLHAQYESYNRDLRPRRTITPAAAAIVAGLDAPVTAPDVFRAVLRQVTAEHGKTLACEQTPRNVYYLAEIFELFPDARVLNIVRDPRDVLLSQKNWWRRRFQPDVDVPWSLSARRWADFHPITTSLLWRSGVRAGAAFDDHPHVRSLRFEDLVVDPDRSLRRIASFLALDYDERMVDVSRISSSNTSDRAGSGVDPSVVGGYRQRLTTTERWISQRINHREIERYGFERDEVRPNLVRAIATGCTLPLKLGLATAFNVRRTTSIVSSVRRRLRPTSN